MNKRIILANIWQNIDNDQILILNGARQTGKTTLLKMIQKKLISQKKIKESHIINYDLEKSEDLAIWSDQATALKLLPKRKDLKHYLFIDEFQKSKTIGSTLKVIHDHHSHIKIIITGSASWYLDIDESMAGRKKVFNIWPLSFQEYLIWTNKDNLLPIVESKDSESLSNHSAIDIINNHYLDYITYGGYPKVVLAGDKADKASLLSELVNSYILKDIQLWNYAANTLAVRKLLTLLASQIGSVLSIESLCQSSAIGRTALKNRLELLQNTFILLANQPYFTNKQKELVKSPKLYLVDTGLRNSLLSNFSILPQTKDFGYLAENSVVTELYKNSSILDKIHFWRTKIGGEVDIIKKKENDLVPIEVKSGNANSIPSGLKSFINSYHPTEAYVLNWSIVKDIDYMKTKVKFRPLWYQI
jgi:uncharacterized protein